MYAQSGKYGSMLSQRVWNYFKLSMLFRFLTFILSVGQAQLLLTGLRILNASLASYYHMIHPTINNGEGTIHFYIPPGGKPHNNIVDEMIVIGSGIPPDTFLVVTKLEDSVANQKCMASKKDSIR